MIPANWCREQFRRKHIGKKLSAVNGPLLTCLGLLPYENRVADLMCDSETTNVPLDVGLKGDRLVRLYAPSKNFKLCSLPKVGTHFYSETKCACQIRVANAQAFEEGGMGSLYLQRFITSKTGARRKRRALIRQVDVTADVTADCLR